MTMTRKDFRMVADVINMGDHVFRSKQAKNQFIGGMSWYFKHSYPRFDEKKFRERATTKKVM